eukprot:gnl/Hemi2/9041_TR3126_c0_g1_i1.p2 gnl/Hemi2/9041_TR3126_c0_g1~~gnl/Hemi2/9041_TR3126_c0_g1_i1.p2  ORF type:complete len:167 (-),score=28.66 gnl/Hemi2/9041_TR3126_c0_g1_i1:176-676(-)
MWYPWLARKLKEQGYDITLRGFPDPLYARESVWLPFMTEQLGAGPDTIVVGHSSGAAAAMRLVEKTRLAGVILVSAYHTDLGDETERESGYFSRPWNWAQMRANCPAIVQFHARDDHLVPVEAARTVARELQTDYREFESGGHFQGDTFPELLKVITERTWGCQIQ